MSAGRVMAGILNAIAGLVLFLACYRFGANIYIIVGCLAGILLSSVILIVSSFDAVKSATPKSYSECSSSKRIH